MTHKSKTVWCVIPAAGVGARLGGEIPKQYLALGGQAILSHAIAAFQRRNDIQGIVVAVSSGDPNVPQLSSLRWDKVHTCLGGPSRAHSVLHGLQYLRSELGADDQDWVMVHDAARPLISGTDIGRLLASCHAGGFGGILAAPVADTIKRVDGSRQIVATEDRQQLWRALTPQCFPVGLLISALESALDQAVEITDEAAAMEWAGHPVRVVEGSPRNIKITVPADLDLAHYLLER